MARRFCVSLLFILAIIFLPWWISFSIGFIFLIWYKNFWELIAGAIYVDLLYGVPISYFGNFTFVLTLSTALIFIMRRILGANLFNKDFNL